MDINNNSSNGYEDIDGSSTSTSTKVKVDVRQWQKAVANASLERLCLSLDNHLLPKRYDARRNEGTLPVFKAKAKVFPVQPPTPPELVEGAEAEAEAEADAEAETETETETETEIEIEGESTSHKAQLKEYVYIYTYIQHV